MGAVCTGGSVWGRKQGDFGNALDVEIVEPTVICFTQHSVVLISSNNSRWAHHDGFVCSSVSSGFVRSTGVLCSIESRVLSIKTPVSSTKTRVSSFNWISRKRRICSFLILETRVLTRDSNFSNPRSTDAWRCTACVCCMCGGYHTAVFMSACMSSLSIDICRGLISV